MNTLDPNSLPAPRRTPISGGASSALRTLWQREPRLVGFALLMLALMLPAAIGLGLDERMLRGVNVWVKPMKFMASVALLALTTAWFAAQLPASVRRGRAFAALVWTLIATGGFEVGYTTLQAARGGESHYKGAGRMHRMIYRLMGVGALLLTATQPWLAWLIWRHGDRSVAPAYRLSVLLGLTLTFVLGAGVGMLLGGMQPPGGAGLPVLGWSRTGGDLRVAHFIGIHAGQVLPVIGFVLATWRPRGALRGVWVAASLWAGLWAVTLAQALSGRPLIAL
jgi:hypothetical protein